MAAQEDIATELERKISDGLINGELEPIMCDCGSTEFFEKTTDRIDFLICEKDRFCKTCKKLVGSWAHGFWLP